MKRSQKVLLGLEMLECEDCGLEQGPRTQAEIAAFCQVSQAAIAKAEKTILEKLRKRARILAIRQDLVFLGGKKLLKILGD